MFCFVAFLSVGVVLCFFLVVVIGDLDIIMEKVDKWFTIEIMLIGFNRINGKRVKEIGKRLSEMIDNWNFYFLN